VHAVGITSIRYEVGFKMTRTLRQADTPKFGGGPYFLSLSSTILNPNKKGDIKLKN
jgi:hypothetical protein